MRFENFLKDMGPRPSPKHTIDRIHGNKNYSKSNCRWSTRAEQLLNKKNTIMLTAFGETKPLIVWAKEKGISRDMLVGRVKKLGWTAERALTEPSRR